MGCCFFLGGGLINHCEKSMNMPANTKKKVPGNKTINQEPSHMADELRIVLTHFDPAA